MNCDVGRRSRRSHRSQHGSDPSFLWLWHRLAAAAPTGPLAWEVPYASGIALKTKQTNKQKLKVLLWGDYPRLSRWTPNAITSVQRGRQGEISHTHTPLSAPEGPVTTEQKEI